MKMKMTKAGDPEIIRRMKIVSLKCAACGAEYEMDRVDYENLLGVSQHCTYCNSRNTVYRMICTLNG